MVFSSLKWFCRIRRPPPHHIVDPPVLVVSGLPRLREKSKLVIISHTNKNKGKEKKIKKRIQKFRVYWGVVALHWGYVVSMVLQAKSQW